MMQTPELISWETLLSIGGVAALTLLITNLLRQRLGVSPRWLPLVLAPALMVLATVAVATTQQQPVTWQALALAVGNGLIMWLLIEHRNEFSRSPARLQAGLLVRQPSAQRGCHQEEVPRLRKPVRKRAGWITVTTAPAPARAAPWRRPA